MGVLQESEHGAGFDYERGSPHLHHLDLRRQIVKHIRGLIEEQFARTGACRVLEVGAGHGGFTDHIAASGADVTVTEMSRPSLEVLRARFGRNAAVRLLYDRDGEQVFANAEVYDLVLCVSVLHHIPDYLGYIDRLTEKISVGGSFASFQDPLWYPRRSRKNLCLDRGAFYLWRLTQPDRFRGFKTFMRRTRRIYDETNPSDMVEYHVVRSGVDEVAIERLLSDRFAEVGQWRYWSTQSPALQLAGCKLGLESTFGIVARSRLDSSWHPSKEAGAHKAAGVNIS